MALGVEAQENAREVLHQAAGSGGASQPFSFIPRGTLLDVQNPSLSRCMAQPPLTTSTPVTPQPLLGKKGRFLDPRLGLKGRSLDPLLVSKGRPLDPHLGLKGRSLDPRLVLKWRSLDPLLEF